MNYIAIYAVLSTVAFGWVASIWSSDRGINIVVKSCFVGIAALGAICSAKLIF